jgi:cellulose biosynthesis protein BcsQ
MTTKTIVFGNNKGGVGKTPASYYIAQRLAQNKLDVCVIDLDGQCTLTDMLLPGKRNHPTIVDVLKGEATLDQALEFVPLRNETAIRLATATGELYDLESSLSTGLGVMKLYHALKNADSLGDVVIIDTPPNLGAMTLGAIIAAGMMRGYIIVPTRLDGASVSGIKSIAEKIDEARQIPGCHPHLLGTIGTMDRGTNTNDKWRMSLEADDYPPMLGCTALRGGDTADYDLTKLYSPIADIIWKMVGGST